MNRILSAAFLIVLLPGVAWGQGNPIPNTNLEFDSTVLLDVIQWNNKPCFLAVWQPDKTGYHKMVNYTGFAFGFCEFHPPRPQLPKALKIQLRVEAAAFWHPKSPPEYTYLSATAALLSVKTWTKLQGNPSLVLTPGGLMFHRTTRSTVYMVHYDSIAAPRLVAMIFSVNIL